MSKWAHLENTAIILSITFLLYFGQLWSLLLLLALNAPKENSSESTPGKKEGQDEN
jgi:hypothetical protein